MSWQTKKLGEVCNFQNGFAFKSSDYADSGFFVMRIGNVQDGYISLSNPKYIKKSHKSFEKFILQSGDILGSQRLISEAYRFQRQKFTDDQVAYLY